MKEFAEQCAEVLVPQGIYTIDQAPVEMSDFYLDRYPVTVERFGHFIEAKGYLDFDYWDEIGWQWRVENNILMPRFWDDPKWQHFLTRDRPVVGVSYYEARAFCRFVARRLPTLKEWRAAAGGPKDWHYPWGSEWQNARLANRGIGPRCTWPVGFIEGGRGPLGHDDMLGNIWHWLSSEEALNHTDIMIPVAGGSWAARDDLCSNTHYNHFYPYGQWSHLGFRTTRLKNG